MNKADRALIKELTEALEWIEMTGLLKSVPDYKGLDVKETVVALISSAKKHLEDTK